MTTRVLHVIAPFDRRDAVGRAVEEIARHHPEIESDLCTSRVLNGASAFHSVYELGGSDASFHITRWRAIAETIDAIRPDIVHLHGGIWLPFLAMSPAFRRPVVLSVYRWPRLPPLSVLMRGAWAEMRVSGVPRGLLVLSTLLPRRVVHAALARRRVRGVLTQDPALARELESLSTPVVYLSGGGSKVDHLRARYQPDAPLILFAGRAQTARGIDTLIAAMPKVLRTLPTARLKMMLLPTRGANELPRLRRSIIALGIGQSVEVDVIPAEDLRERFAEAAVSVFPFKFDDTTLTPPFTVLEAMSVGLPVVATRVACLSPIMRDGENGITIPVGDPASLARAITTILTDERTWRTLSDGAIRTVEGSWNWKRAAAVTGALYDEVLRAS